MNDKAAKGRKAIALDWLAKGPFAIIAASLQGGVNYAITLYLSFGVSMAATGEYRTLFSYYMLLALAAMPESNKVFIRSVVEEDRQATTALFINRLICGLVVFLCIAGLWSVGKIWGVALVPDMLMAIAAISAIAYPFDNYIALLQARRRFRMLVLVECIKYGGAAACFVGMIMMGRGVAVAVLAQLLFMGAAMVVFYMVFARSWFLPGHVRARGPSLMRSEPARQARTLSFANFLPSSLDSLDKLAVGAVFGMHRLGIYTLAYSTGRFLYNILKPAMYVYYRKFVDAMPGWPLLMRVGGIFSALGAATSLLFLVGIETVPAMARFDDGKWTTVILFLSYGVGIVSAVYTQAFALNRESVAHHVLVGNMLGTIAAFALMGLALLVSWPLALILLALQYPLRDGLSVLIMNHMRINNMK